ncbi:MAG: hypothetical protein M3Q74_06405, partial [Pseudomonadota bacterium]|nr:hypothetical protein [Pseudomonadota bacterium]
VAASEAQLRRAVLDAAALFGWTVHEVPEKAYMVLAKLARENPRQGRLVPRRGFPDLLLLRAGSEGEPARMLALELKSARGAVRPEQAAVLALLGAVPGVDARVVRPADLEGLLGVLA